MTNSNFSISAYNSYSLALYELAEENKILDQIEDQVSALNKLISESNDFILAIKNPTLKQEDQLNIISLISEKFGFNQLFKKFINFLIFKRRIFYVENIQLQVFLFYRHGRITDDKVEDFFLLP